MADAVTFARPELLALALLAPLAAATAVWLWHRRLLATEAWAARVLWRRLVAVPSRRRIALSTALLGITVLGIVLALARPRWGESMQTVERQGIDLVLVVDASRSMGARDVAPTRLEVAEALVRRLIQATPGNRVALVAAEGDGVVMAPLTTDVAVVDLLLDGIEPGALPVPGTRLGDALDQLPELYPPAEPGASGRHRAAVLLSDGEDHGGGLEERIERLAEAGVVVHTVGVGTLEGAPVPVPGRAGAVRRRSDGSVVVSRLDEGVLEAIARGTGGVYLRGTDPGRSLRPLLDALAGMERRPVEATELETHAERFQWPLAAAAAALLLHLALSPLPGGPAAGSGAGDRAGGRRSREAAP